MSQVQKKKNFTRRTLQCRATRQNTDSKTGNSNNAVPLSFGGGYKLPITHSVLDYSEVPIPEDSVIYCDIPYLNTGGYPIHGGFDYERFYQWAEKQTEPVFISSYQMPEDRFVCITEFDHRCSFAQKANNKVTERIFVPKRQKERGNTFSQPSLYDLMSM